jgi:hypothetical protein
MAYNVSGARRSVAEGFQQSYAKHLRKMRRMCPDFFVLEKNLDQGAIATKLVPGVIRSFLICVETARHGGRADNMH